MQVTSVTNTAKNVFLLTPKQARTVYWLNGLAPLATNVVTPLVTAYQLKRSNLNSSEQQALTLQEMVRQAISALIHLSTYFGGALLASRLPGSQGTRSIRAIVGGTFASFIGYGVIRPVVSNGIVSRWLVQSKNVKNSRTHAGQNTNPFTKPDMALFASAPPLIHRVQNPAF